MKIMIADRRGKEYTLYDSSIGPAIERLKACKEFEAFGEDELYAEALNHLQDQYEVLCTELTETMPDGDYIALVDLGLWNGRHHGYQTFENPELILSMFGCDEVCVTFDQYNVRSAISHPDGTHYVLFRRFKDHVSKATREMLCGAVSAGVCTGEDIKRYTTSIRPDIKNLPSLDLKVKPNKDGIRYAYPL